MCQVYFTQIDLFNALFNSMKMVCLLSCFTIRETKPERSQVTHQRYATGKR